MTDLPIIFSGPMVRALLDGRKTMTRRILKPQPEIFLIDGKPAPVTILHVDGDPRPRVAIGRVLTAQTVRFAVGDRLWVRESFFLADAYLEAKKFTGGSYKADELNPHGLKLTGWRPSIYMPRWASRLTLVVAATKIERLQEIGKDDALAEGVQHRWLKSASCAPRSLYYVADSECEHSGPSAQAAFEMLWCSLHGAGAWDDDPWVAALTFTVHHINIDAMPKTQAA